MDPNQNLTEQLRLAAQLQAHAAEDADYHLQDTLRLAELVEALHEWLLAGGALPEAWEEVGK